MNKLFIFFTVIIIISYFIYNNIPSTSTSTGNNTTQAVSTQPVFKDGLYIIQNNYKKYIVDNNSYLTTDLSQEVAGKQTPAFLSGNILTPPPYGNTNQYVLWNIVSNDDGSYSIQNVDRASLTIFKNTYLAASNTDLNDTNAFLFINDPVAAAWDIILNTDGSYCIQHLYHKDGSNSFLSSNGSISGYITDPFLYLKGIKYSDAGQEIYWILLPFKPTK